MPGLVTWTTDVPSSSQVEYGTTTAYGTLTPLDPARVTSHSVQLPALSPGITYHYRVRSRNSIGTEVVGADATFGTGGTPVALTITWTTNVVASSQVEYGPTTAYGTLTVLDPARVTSHSVLVPGLGPGTFHYRVRSRNSAGTEVVSSDHSLLVGTGTGAANAPTLFTAALGTVVFPGAVAAPQSRPTLAAAGAEAFSGTLSAAISQPSMAATGNAVINTSGSGTPGVTRPSVSVGSGTVAGSVVGTFQASIVGPTAVGVGGVTFPGAGTLTVARPSATGTGGAPPAMLIASPTVIGFGGVGGGTGGGSVAIPTATIFGGLTFSGITASPLTANRPTAVGAGQVGAPQGPILLRVPTAVGTGTVTNPPPGPPVGSAVTIITWIDPGLVEHQLTGQPDLEIIQGRTGLFMPPVKITEDALPGMNLGGSRLRDQLYDSREIDLPLFLHCPDYATLWARHSEIGSWFRLRRDTSGRPIPGRLRVMRPDGSEREIVAVYSSGLQGAEGSGVSGPLHRQMILVLKASDPLWYARNPTTLVFTILAGGGTFFTTPFLPIKLGTSSVATGAVVNNTGEEVSWPVWQIVGPGANPVLSNNTTGQSLALTIALTAGQSVTIDTRPTAKSIVNDQTGLSLYSALAPGSATMWPLQPGTNSIQVLMGGASAASRLNLTFTPVFLGA